MPAPDSPEIITTWSRPRYRISLNTVSAKAKLFKGYAKGEGGKKKINEDRRGNNIMGGEMRENPKVKWPLSKQGRLRAEKKTHM